MIFSEAGKHFSIHSSLFKNGVILKMYSRTVGLIGVIWVSKGKERVFTDERWNSGRYLCRCFQNSQRGQGDYDKTLAAFMTGKGTLELSPGPDEKEVTIILESLFGDDFPLKFFLREINF